MQVVKHLFQRKAVRVPQGKNNRILGRRGLQFEIELAAEALAQSKAPGAVQAAAERRMHHQLHATAFVKETFQYESVLGWNHTQAFVHDGQIGSDLFGSGCRDAGVLG